MAKDTRVAIDVGGTFTDVVSLSEKTGELRFDKVPTTPTDPQQGVLDGMDAAGTPISAIDFFVHGTTLGLNALLTRRGAVTGIITTEGFRDVYLLGRTDRIPMYDFKYKKPESLVERYQIVEVPERLDFSGNVLREFDDAVAREVVARLVSQGVESIAVAFLHSYVNPAHEQKMAEIIAEIAPNLEVTLSSDLSREIREYERTSTAVLDAYIKPIVRRYLSKLQNSLKKGGFAGQFLMTRSGGGAMTAAAAQEAPVNLILSGPAGGVLGASWFSGVTDHLNLITIDMGGTSLDASLVIDGKPLTHFDATFEGLPINLASLYIHTIGAGGGSIVWIDEGNHLQVGPASAGADPGPAAYGRGGTEATFTDAALHVGYLGNGSALAGSLELDASLAQSALSKSADRLGMGVDDVALGVIRISTTKIVGAVRSITVELGHNPAESSLLSFGGGGGLVAVEVARELSIPHVVVPPGPGAFSAFGMLMADVQHDFSRTRITGIDSVDTVTMAKDFETMEAEGAKVLHSEGFSAEEQLFSRFVDLRYVGQEHSVTLQVGPSIDESEIARLNVAFAQSHEKAYGHTMPDPVELVALRVNATGKVEKPTLPPALKGKGTPTPIAENQVYVGGNKRVSYPVYDRDSLGAGDVVEGPAIITEHTATTVMHQGDSAKIGALGEIVISVSKGE